VASPGVTRDVDVDIAAFNALQTVQRTRSLSHTYVHMLEIKRFYFT
jgi:hypothetical protein